MFHYGKLGPMVGILENSSDFIGLMFCTCKSGSNFFGVGRVHEFILICS